MNDPLKGTHIRKPKAAWWPNGQQVQLLRACFLEGEQGVAAWQAWQAWRAECDLGDVDAETRSLLPLLYQNLSRQGVVDPAMAKLKGFHHYTWTSSVSTLQELLPLVAALKQTGIDTALIKGAALPYYAYRQPGLRSNDDFGLLVRPEQRAALFDFLERQGYQPVRAVPMSRLPLMHRLEFRGQHDSSLVIQWQLLWEGIYSGTSDDSWSRLDSMALNGVEMQTLSATDHLLQVCIDGLWARPQPSVRWIADALTILRSSHPADWDRLVTQAQKYHVTLTLGHCLTCLSETLDAAIPPEVIAQLVSSNLPRLERLEYRIKTRPGARRAGLTGLLHNAIRLRLGQGQPRRSLARFLQQWWGLTSYRQLPSGIAGAVRKEFRQMSSR